MSSAKTLPVANVDAHQQIVAQACRTLRAQIDSRMSLRELAGQFGMSPSHFQRVFTRVMGVSPKEYADSCRIERFKFGLRDKANVTEALYDAGYGSASRVYEKSTARLGMTPRHYARGGEGLELMWSTWNTRTPWGTLLVAATERGICSVLFGRSGKEVVQILRQEFSRATLTKASGQTRAQLQVWGKLIQAHLKKTRQTTQLAKLPLDIVGTAFQRRVWKFLQSIPEGETRSYAEIAHAIGHPRAHRAVGSACGANPVSVVVPCHRALRGDGSLGGYRWGVKSKKSLIKMEQRRTILG